VPLRATSYLFRRGHRIRLSLALADFPRIWPGSQPGTIVVHQASDGPSCLFLPRTPAQVPPPPLPQLPPLGDGLKSPAELESDVWWSVNRELVRRWATLESRTVGRYQLTSVTTMRLVHDYTAKILATDPAGTCISSYSEVSVEGDGRQVEVVAESVATPDFITIKASVAQPGRVIYHKEWRVRRKGS
jgi:hypothetical protein